MTDDCPELVRFVRGEIDPTLFPPREHVRMAFEMLRRHDFATTAQHYSQALRLMSSRAGRPQAFNQTLTIAFLSLIAEPLAGAADLPDFAAFLAAHPQLLDKGALVRWYSPERLASELARRTFLLPDLSAVGAAQLKRFV
jgi:hypothetical protein